MRSEYEANLSLVPMAAQPTWMKPVRHKLRPIPWYTKLFMWFKG